MDGELTACAYITTDKADNQITGFNPGAMKYSSSLEFDNLNPKETLVIFIFYVKNKRTESFWKKIISPAFITVTL